MALILQLRTARCVEAKALFGEDMVGMADMVDMEGTVSTAGTVGTAGSAGIVRMAGTAGMAGTEGMATLMIIGIRMVTMEWGIMDPDS